MATVEELRDKLRVISNLEGSYTHAQRVCDKLSDESIPDDWAWITIHACNDYEVSLDAPSIPKAFMKALIEEYGLDKLREEVKEAKERFIKAANEIE